MSRLHTQGCLDAIRARMLKFGHPPEAAELATRMASVGYCAGLSPENCAELSVPEKMTPEIELVLRMSKISEVFKRC